MTSSHVNAKDVRAVKAVHVMIEPESGMVVIQINKQMIQVVKNRVW